MRLVRRRDTQSGAAQGLPAAFVISPETKQIASAFLDLQEKRHAADYDLTVQFTRSDVLYLIEETEDAVKRFKSLARSCDKSFFLACLWAWSALAKR